MSCFAVTALAGVENVHFAVYTSGIRPPFNYISVSQNNQPAGASRNRNELPHVIISFVRLRQHCLKYIP